MMLLRALLAAVGLLVGTITLWPAPAAGPEPISWGRDMCAMCRMHLSRPGFAGQRRHSDGSVAKYDDVGCLVRAVLNGGGEAGGAWVEDHATGDFVPLRRATLVRADPATTPMGSGLLAFADTAAANRYADAHRASLMTFDDLVRDASLVARLAPPPARDSEDVP